MEKTISVSVESNSLSSSIPAIPYVKIHRLWWPLTSVQTLFTLWNEIAWLWLIRIQLISALAVRSKIKIIK